MSEPEPVLSIVVPCYNEAGNLAELVERLAAALPADGGTAAEFVLVDDGSDDGTAEILARLARADARVVPVCRTERGGQTQALWSGFAAARGGWIGGLDGDLQNDPADLPRLYAQARRENLDAVLGFRATRHDDLGRRLSSRFANAVRRCVLGDTIRDIGCSTRVVRREALRGLEPLPNVHRYLPALIEAGGWRIAQVPVAHRPRRAGVSKYGNLSRGLAGLRDLPRMASYVRSIRRRSRMSGPIGERSET